MGSTARRTDTPLPPGGPIWLDNLYGFNSAGKQGISGAYGQFQNRTEIVQKQAHYSQPRRKAGYFPSVDKKDASNFEV